MIGRDDDIDDVATALLSGTNLILAGPRRTGKTSVCEAALGRARKRGCYTARLDLFRISDTAELAEALALAVISNRSPARRLVRKARQLGRATLSAAQAAAVLKLQGQFGEAIELALTPGWTAQDPQRALDLALELPERVAVADDRRMILFFDEFPELASERHPFGDPDLVTKRMRAVQENRATPKAGLQAKSGAPPVFARCEAVSQPLGSRKVHMQIGAIRQLGIRTSGDRYAREGLARPGQGADCR
jgi:AAA+ ATPase superfamily predicted ATPase